MLLVSNENEIKYQHLGGRKELRYEHTSFAIKGKPHPNSYIKIQKKEFRIQLLYRRKLAIENKTVLCARL